MAILLNLSDSTESSVTKKTWETPEIEVVSFKDTANSIAIASDGVLKHS